MDLAADAPLFEAVIVPHRSLSARAQRRLLVAVALAIGVSVTVSLALGAWPVTGFAGAELLLAAGLLRLHARRARSCETLLLTPGGLSIRRTTPGRTPVAFVLPLAWLRVSLEESPGRAPRLLLRAHGIAEEVGASLGEDEKRDLAAALAEALRRWNHPEFDDPRTREAAAQPCSG